jgi:hypothetical protein
MNSILFAIFVYAFLSVFWAYVFNMSPGKTKFLAFSNFLIFSWSVFMLFYYVVGYKKIMSSPLNVSISFFESVTNIFPVIYIIALYLNFKEKRKTEKNDLENSPKIKTPEKGV